MISDIWKETLKKLINHTFSTDQCIRETKILVGSRWKIYSLKKLLNLK